MGFKGIERKAKWHFVQWGNWHAIEELHTRQLFRNDNKNHKASFERAAKIQN